MFFSASPAPAERLKEPSQRVDHNGLGITGPSEDIHAVAVGLILLFAAVAIGDEHPRDRGDPAAPGEDLVENDHTDVQTGVECLRLCDVAQIVVGELVGKYTPELIVVRLLEQTPCDIELATAGAGRVDLRIVHDPNAHLA